jgi:uncharacterized protein YciI
MLFAIIAEDHEDSLSRRLEARPLHLARLETLQSEGRLVLAGPFPTVAVEAPGPLGFSGSLIVAEFETLEAATGWADADPYVSAGVYRHVIVKPFKQVFPS